MFSFVVSIATIFSCKTKSEKKFCLKQLRWKIIDFVINQKDNSLIELPDIYDSFATVIPDDSSEKLILVQSLKKKGFKVIDWGHGNFPPCGIRIVSLKLKKDSCFCEVSKIHYATAHVTLYRMSERINCSDSLTFSKLQRH